jgi:hypothetical protein
MQLTNFDLPLENEVQLNEFVNAIQTMTFSLTPYQQGEFEERKKDLVFRFNADIRFAELMGATLDRNQIHEYILMCGTDASETPLYDAFIRDPFRLGCAIMHQTEFLPRQKELSEQAKDRIIADNAKDRLKVLQKYYNYYCKSLTSYRRSTFTPVTMSIMEFRELRIIYSAIANAETLVDFYNHEVTARRRIYEITADNPRELHNILRLKEDSRITNEKVYTEKYSNLMTAWEENFFSYQRAIVQKRVQIEQEKRDIELLQSLPTLAEIQRASDLEREEQIQNIKSIQTILMAVFIYWFLAFVLNYIAGW